MSVPIDPELLLEQTGWLRRLAMRLVGDPQQREDLLQETWVAALENPPAATDRRGLRGWLANVLRNRARRMHRVRARSAVRERLAARDEALPAASDSLERAELQRQLMDAVLELAPGQRDVILLRYQDGLSPREIARRLGVAGGAVRMRLSRARKELRRKLDREHQGDRGAWSLAFLMHLAERGKGWNLGVLLVKTQTKTWAAALLAVGLIGMAGVLALLGGGWDPSTPKPPEALTAGTSSEPELPGPATSPARPADPATDRAAVDPPTEPEEPGSIELAGRVIDPRGQPVPGVTVRIEHKPNRSGSWVPVGEAWSTTTGELGEFRLTHTWQWTRLRVVSDEWVVLQDERFGAEVVERELVVVVAPRCDYFGLVVDEEERPVSGARISVVLDPGVLAELVPGVERTHMLWWHAESDEDGSFELDGIGWFRNVHLRVGQTGFKSVELLLPERDDQELRIVLRRTIDAEFELVGSVLDAQGAGVAKASVILGDVAVEADQAGHFVIPWDGNDGELIALGRGYLPGRALVRKGQESSVVVVLDEPALEIVGRVVDRRGEGVPRASVWCRDVTEIPRTGDNSPRLVEAVTGGFERRGCELTADSAGHFELRGLLPRTYHLFAMHPQTLEVVGRDVEAGTEVELTLDGGEPLQRIAGHVVSYAGDPVEGVTLLLWREGVHGMTGRGSPWLIDYSRRSDADGFFEMEGIVVAGAHFYLSSPKAGGYEVALDSSMDLENLELRVPLACRIQIVLAQDPEEADRVGLLDAEGQPVPHSINLGETVGGGVVSLGGRGGVSLSGGRSAVLKVDESLKTLVLRKEGEVVRQIPVTLTPGDEVEILEL